MRTVRSLVCLLILSFKFLKYHYFSLFPLGRLEVLVAEIRGGRQTFAQMKGGVVMFDTTHGTNVYGAKLGLFSMVCPDGRTTIIAMSIIAGEESGETLSFAFASFKKIFNDSPNIFLTDGCVKIKCALDTAMPTVRHHLCVWHIFKNFFKHLHSKVGKAQWKQLNDTFWRLALATDVATIDSFNSEFESLLNLIESFKAEGNANDIDAALLWMRESLYQKRESWAYRFTSRYFTAGCHSTQRCESIHSALKKVSLISTTFYPCVSVSLHQVLSYDRILGKYLV